MTALLAEITVTVKTSLLWSSRELVFQQIRDQDYALGCLLGLEPHSVRLWVVPKEDLWSMSGPQHAGRRGTDTHWLRFPASAPPPALSSFGGGLSAARTLLEEAADGGTI
jgi:hypothetical protein